MIGAPLSDFDLTFDEELKLRIQNWILQRSQQAPSQVSDSTPVQSTQDDGLYDF